MIANTFTYTLIPQVDRVIFCVFVKTNYKIYSDLLHYYFPLWPEEPRACGKEEKEGEWKEEGTRSEKKAQDVQRSPASTTATSSKKLTGEKQQLLVQHDYR